MPRERQGIVGEILGTPDFAKQQVTLLACIGRGRTALLTRDNLGTRLVLARFLRSRIFAFATRFQRLGKTPHRERNLFTTVRKVLWSIRVGVKGHLVQRSTHAPFKRNLVKLLLTRFIQKCHTFRGLVNLSRPNLETRQRGITERATRSTAQNTSVQRQHLYSRQIHTLQLF